MRSSLRSAPTLARLGPLALAVCLLAPPLAHSRSPHHVPIATIEGQPCTSSDAAAHLHAASVRPAPRCAACAAGPTWVGVKAQAEGVLPPAIAGPLRLLLATGVGADLGPTRRSRAPPAIPTV